MKDKPREACGVFGIYGDENSDVAADAYYALYALQHRGQESCGIAVCHDGLITGYRDLGLVRDVLTPDQFKKIAGEGDRPRMALGHCRYGTTGGASRANAQPLVVQHGKGGMALAHNGNITNASELREELELRGAIFHTTADTEAIAYVITGARLETDSIEAAVSLAMDRLKGAFSIGLMSPRKLIGARDPNGFRPLCLGKRGSAWAIASESCALDIIGAEFIRDIRPGEVVTIGENGLVSDTSHCRETASLCVFEFIYFARPDSCLDGSSVYQARLRAGTFLALEYPAQADVVIGVPDSGLDAALGYARQSGIPYSVGFIKNKYIGRTFIQPGQNSRDHDVKIKLNVLKSAIAGKRVIVVEDSVVRGTTTAATMRLLRDAGAREIHLRVASPPFRYPCWFGTDVDSEEHLLAYNRSV
ncbi:MAG: amidophosphoribosyltransferase, partial [Clostridiales bacterium]|nr:amidophosphoribosyltransferase [Clostridiales bacterium]